MKSVKMFLGAALLASMAMSAHAKDEELVFNCASEIGSFFDCDAFDAGVGPNGTASESIKNGYNYIMNSYGTIGPGGLDHSGALECRNCHLGGGLVPNGNPLYHSFAKWGDTAGDGNIFRPHWGIYTNIAERLKQCGDNCTGLANGIPLTHQSTLDMIAYIEWLGTLITDPAMQADWKQIPNTSGPANKPANWRFMVANKTTGEELYEDHCDNCHGRDGQGERDGNDIIYPAMWGNNSWTMGAGYYKVPYLATIIQEFMPLDDINDAGGSSHSGGVLTYQEALNIAYYLNSKPRHRPAWVDDPNTGYYTATMPDGSPTNLKHPADWDVGNWPSLCDHYGPGGVDREQVLSGPWQPIQDCLNTATENWNNSQGSGN